MACQKRRGPCGCFGISLQKGSQIFAVFDIITGLLLFLGFLIIFVTGETGEKKVYPSEKFNVPKEVVITFIILGYYNASTGLMLYFAAGYRKIFVCVIWIICNLPLMLIDFLKIYQLVVVYMFIKEIKQGKTQSVKRSDDEDSADEG